jgi:transcriptional regulator with XRE-family HTH domain
MTLSEYLSANGKTQAQFAAEIDVEQATIARYARGARMPRSEHIEAIEKATGGLVTANDHFRVVRAARAPSGAAA